MEKKELISFQIFLRKVVVKNSLSLYTALLKGERQKKRVNINKFLAPAKK